MNKKHPIRQITGLTQEELAYSFNINKSRIAMYETGQRELSVNDIIVLGEAEIRLSQTYAERELPEVKAAEAARNDYIQQAIQKLQYRKIKVMRAKEELQEKYQQSIELLRLVQSGIGMQNPSAKKNLLHKAQAGMQKYGTKAALQLQVQLATIEFQLDYYSALLQERT